WGFESLSDKKCVSQPYTDRFQIVALPLIKRSTGLKTLNVGPPRNLPNKQTSSLRKQFQGAKSFVLLTQGDRGVAQRLRAFIAHAELFETCEGFARQLCRILIDVELEINLRKVELAKCRMIGVAGCVGCFACSSQFLYSLSIGSA